MTEILGDLIECGVNIYNPVQISANNMAPEMLKERFGKNIVFHGGVYDAVKFRGEPSPDVIYESVKANIRTFSKNGGYLFAGVHNLPPDIPEAHLEAMLSAYRDCCRESSLLTAGTI
jgi:uroporphyrinogen decarboxylase